MNVTSLDNVGEGLTAMVLEVNIHGWSRRLYQVGVLPGSKVEVVSNKGRGPIVIRVGGVLISIGRGIAKRIVVKVDSSGEEDKDRVSGAA